MHFQYIMYNVCYIFVLICLAEDTENNVMDCDFNLLMEDSLTPTRNFSNDSLHMKSTPEKTHVSLERGISDELAPTLNVTDNSSTLFEDINEVLEAVMHEDGQ